MNPYTGSLFHRIQDPRLAEFVMHWDPLEALVIRVFKGKSASPEDETEHCQLREWLLNDYPNWKSTLEPYWQVALVGGHAPQKDPFEFLLSVPQASGYIKNWAAMQNLPAARQALNQFILDRIEQDHAA
jgi:hypothetical protein